MNDKKLSEFYLVGGTALSLRLGHRKSLDIDLFSDKKFNSKEIKQHIQSTYRGDKLRSISNGVFGYIDKIKIDIISHQYSLLKEVEMFEGIRMASLDDISAMKIHAIVQSGARLKDFVDIHQLLEHRSLDKILSDYEKKYPDVSRQIGQNGLLYHADIDFSQKVTLTKGEFNWNYIQNRIKDATLKPKKIYVSESKQDRTTLNDKMRIRRGKRPRI